MLLEDGITGLALSAWIAVLVLFALNRCGVLPRRGLAIRVYGVSKAEAQARVLIAVRGLRSCGSPIRVFFVDGEGWKRRRRGLWWHPQDITRAVLLEKGND